jgi:RNase adaptor protein for sRNA GlmZ degradation
MSSNMGLSRREEIKRKPGWITLVSMAKRTKTPESDLYVDVTTFMDNNFPLDTSGLDIYVQNSLVVFHADFFDRLEELIPLLGVERGLLVVVACNTGIRRSVATVEVLARELHHHKGYQVEVIHKELNKWFKF